MKNPLLIVKNMSYLNTSRVRLILIELAVLTTALFAQSIDSAKVITPRDSAYALLDTTETCTSKFGADTARWNDCVNLRLGWAEYCTFKKGKISGPAWEIIGSRGENGIPFSENGAFLHYKNDDFLKVVMYTSNGYIDRIWNYKNKNEKEIYYGGRTTPFTGTDSVLKKDTLVSRTDYKNGLKDGLYYSYYPNGKIEYEGFFMKGFQEGRGIYYREDGQIKSESFYKKGELMGNLKEYYENGSIGEMGTLRRLTPYVNGKKDGLVKEYYQNGQICRTISYKKGKREGKQIEYSAKTGKVISTAIFKKDELVGDKKCVDGRFGSEDLDCTPLNE